MKKIYTSFLTVITLLAANTTFSQTSPTITSTSLPFVGAAYYLLTDTTTAEMPTFTVTPASGTYQMWNYTPQFVSVYNDTTAFLATSAGAGHTSFPNANMASKQGGNWAYFKANSSGLLIDGAYVTAMGVTAALDFNPDAPQLPVPFTNGNTQTVTYSAYASTTYSSIPIQIKHHATRTVTADAFGSLVTPTATYTNTLRVKIYETSVDSIIPQFALPTQVTHDTTTDYSWYQPTQNAFVMGIHINKKGAVTKAQYVQSFNNGVAPVIQPSSSFSLFPNPATETTNFTYENKTSGPVNLQLIDASGRLIAVLVNENQAAGSQNIAINIGTFHLPKGLYFLRLNSNNNLQTIKLTVN